MAPKASSTGRRTRGSSRRASRWLSSANQRADQMIMASLASSEGWMRSEPAPNQRVAPLAPTPTPGTRTSARSTKLTTRKGVASRRQSP